MAALTACLSACSEPSSGEKVGVVVVDTDAGVDEDQFVPMPDAELLPDVGRIEPVEALRIASYNLQNLYDLVDDPLKDEAEFTPTPGQWDAQRLAIRLERIANAIVALDADVIALVEIETDLVLGQLADAVLDAGGKDYSYRAISTARNSRNLNVAVLSTLPIRGSRVRPIDHPFECESRETGELVQLGATDTEPRPILQVDVDLGGEPAADMVLLVNHWKAKTNTSFPCDDEAHRERSALALRALYDNLINVLPDRAVVMLGDFNAYEFEPPLRDTMAARLDSGDVSDGGIYNTWGQIIDPAIQGNSNQWNNAGNSTYNFRGSWARLDHILVSSNVLGGGSSSWALTPNSVGTLSSGGLLDRGEPHGWTVDRPTGTTDHLPVFVEMQLR